ncbi:MAG: RAMP superfamily CRISPR-associated protein [Succinimonas sp.]|nr:RAMP superfamily CRISPR-associated protein [Succinimonas sp.]
MSHLILSRIVIETLSPLALSSGGHDLGSSSDVAKDWNGVPYIPATSLMGVWRSAAESSGNAKVWLEWFGFINRRSQGRASRIILSDGLLVNKAGDAGRGLVLKSKLEKDEFTRTNSALIFSRERTRINHRGVADAGGHGKFDTKCLLKGTRFSFDIKAYVDDEGDFTREMLNRIISLIGKASFAVGGGKTNGLGRVKVVGFRQEDIDLKKDKGEGCLRKINDFRKKKEPYVLEAPDYPGICFDDTKLSDNYEELLKMTLNGTGVFTAGTGSAYLHQDLQKLTGSTGVSHPGTEDAVVWTGCQGQIVREQTDKDKAGRELVIPGSEIKGVIAHRVAYHYNRIIGNLADENDFFSKEYKMPEALGKLLFGMAGNEGGEETKQGDAENKAKPASRGASTGLAGRLLFRDAAVAYKKTGVLRSHNRIDRITGGVIDKALFTEELVVDPVFQVNILVTKEAVKVLSGEKTVPGIDEKTVKNVILALKRTVFDLETGLLPIGAKTGRTLCEFTGKINTCHPLLNYKRKQDDSKESEGRQ